MILTKNIIENTHMTDNIQKIEDINIIDNIHIHNMIDNIHIHKLDTILIIDSDNIHKINKNHLIPNPLKLKEKMQIIKPVFKM